MERKPNKLSLIVDIDGVIIKSKKAIPGAKQGIELIQKHNIPFIFFTNNISKSEAFKANQLTQLMTLEKPIERNQVILNYTPMKRLFENWKERLVLIVGRVEIDEILPFEEIPFYITIEEYVHIFPQSTPLTKRDINDSQQIKERVSKRLNIENFNILDLKFDLVLVLNTPTKWEDSIQIIIDILSTADGKVTKQNQYRYHSGHIPIYTALSDFWFRREDHPLPRFLTKPFCLALKAIYKQIYGNELHITHFGKPNHQAFEFAHKHIDSVFGGSEEYVMIGDSIDTDIVGAYNYGWKSVLVKSGVSLHETEKANYSCFNLEEAVRWVLKENGYEES